MSLIDPRAIGLCEKNTGLYWEVGLGSAGLVNPAASNPVLVGRILMEDGVSFILMEDGVSKILLEG